MAFELSNRAAPLSLSSTRWCLVLGHVCWAVRCGLGFVPLVLFTSRLSPFAFRLLLRACRNHGRDIGYWPYSIFLMFMFMFVRWIEGRNNCPCISHLSQITFPRASPAPASPPLACLPVACRMRTCKVNHKRPSAIKSESHAVQRHQWI